MSMEKTRLKRKTPFRKALGDVIREERKRLGCPQDEFAELLEVHRTYLGGIERGERNITIDILEKICVRLDVSISTLIQRAETAMENKR